MHQQRAEKPLVHNCGVGTQVIITDWNGDRAYLASDHYPDLETQQWGYDVYRIPKDLQGMVLISRFPSYFVLDTQISVPCRYYVEACNAPAAVLCPHCARWYCALFWRPALESERAE